ncbi:MAG: hypothetical protein ACI4PG_06435 [Candidatus Ventricola sp.]
MDDHELMVTPEQAQMIPALIQQMMGPLVEAMGKLLEHNTRALEQLAATQQIQADRLEALERQIRLNTLVTPQQVRYLGDAIRKQARALLDKRGIDDKQAINKLSAAIRKELLAHYGIAAMHDLPRHEYSVAMNLISLWNNLLTVRDVVKEARERATEKQGDETA